jgi:hypothetical protein
MAMLKTCQVRLRETRKFGNTSTSLQTRIRKHPNCRRLTLGVMQKKGSAQICDFHIHPCAENREQVSPRRDRFRLCCTTIDRKRR